jgi:ElaA protein
MSPGVVWETVRLDDWSPRALYRAMRARQAVFVVEQACAFLDADAIDERCWHLVGWLREAPAAAVAGAAESLGAPADPGVVVAYARVVPPGVRYAEASIGRVLTLGAGRGVGLGDELMRRAVALAQGRWPGQGIRLSAQARLAAWYARHGFVAEGEPYDEDGIPHIAMVRGASA